MLLLHVFSLIGMSGRALERALFFYLLKQGFAGAKLIILTLEGC